MLDYPSIVHGTGQTFCEFVAHVFGKLDGRNTRWEWSRKRGFHKYGTRTERFGEFDPVYGSAVGLFYENLAKPLDRIFRHERCERAVGFAEFWGDQSLGGVLVPGDVMHLSLIDVSLNGKELLDVRDYVKLFVGKVEAAPYLGTVNWTRGFVERVYQGEVEGMPLEGVVGKGVEGERAKAKTKAWLDAVRARYSAAEAERIVNS